MNDKLHVVVIGDDNTTPPLIPNEAANTAQEILPPTHRHASPHLFNYYYFGDIPRIYLDCNSSSLASNSCPIVS